MVNEEKREARNQVKQAIVSYLIAMPGSTQKDLCQNLGFDSGRVSYSVSVLMGFGMIKKDQDRSYLARYYFFNQSIPEVQPAPKHIIKWVGVGDETSAGPVSQDSKGGKLYTIEQASKILNRTPEVMRMWVKSGLLDAEKHSHPISPQGKWMVREKSILDLKASGRSDKWARHTKKQPKTYATLGAEIAQKAPRSELDTNTRPVNKERRKKSVWKRLFG